MRLRGLCAQSKVGKYYQPMNNFSNFHMLQLVGHLDSTIEYDEKSKNWKLSVAGSNVNGSSPAAHNTFLLGKQKWWIDFDTNCKINGEDREDVMHLKLTGCNPTGEFTCEDG